MVINYSKLPYPPCSMSISFPQRFHDSIRRHTHVYQPTIDSHPNSRKKPLARLTATPCCLPSNFEDSVLSRSDPAALCRNLPPLSSNPETSPSRGLLRLPNLYAYSALLPHGEDSPPRYRDSDIPSFPGKDLYVVHPHETPTGMAVLKIS